MLSRGSDLQNLILQTLKTCSDLVGSTLGPGGMSVVIERQEENMPPIVTKDGVTVFRSLGFTDPTAHVLMETARDASIRTASEAGDGTTTATILAEAFVRYTQEYCNKHPQVSPQLVVRTLQKTFKNVIEPKIDSMLIRPTMGTPEGQTQLHAVAKVSANGDSDLADAVMQCFDIIGDAGNVTIVEATGPSKYVVQKIEGYAIPLGFEECCGPFYQKFVNDPGAQQCLLDRPSFIVYHGRITDFNMLYPILNMIAGAVNDGVQLVEGKKLTHNVVILATGFSETVLAQLAGGFVMEGTLNVFPLLAPMSAVRTGQFDFLMDIAAMSGASMMDPLEKPLQNFSMDDLGVGPTSFECTRFRSSVIGFRDELLLFDRIDQIQKQLTEVAASDLDKILLRERLAKLTSGIARLIVQGPSNGEIKERRDRAEDAVCAVRGAIKYGALPGGGVVLSELVTLLVENPDPIVAEVMSSALLEPIIRLYVNAGFSPDIALQMTEGLEPGKTFDVLEGKWVDPVAGGILDSAPAVREAIRNSISFEIGRAHV